MSAGQPTKLSTTKRSPFDAEIALREVPRSIPTWEDLGSGHSDSFPGVGMNAIEECLRDLLTVFGAAEHRRLAFI